MKIKQLIKNVQSSKKNKMLGLLALFLGISTLVVGYFATRIDSKNNEEFHKETVLELDTINTKTKRIGKDLKEHKVAVDSSINGLEKSDKEISIDVSHIKEETANSSKEILEIKKSQKTNSNYIKDIKTTTDKISFDTASARFFQENDFSKYSNFFIYGFTVYSHSLEFNKPFKKSYGSRVYVEYVDYSDLELIESNDGSYNYELRLKQKFKKVAGERQFSNNRFVYNVGVSFKHVAKIQKLYGIGRYGEPYYNFCDYFVLLNHEKPYTYAIGPQDCDIFKER